MFAPLELTPEARDFIVAELARVGGSRPLVILTWRHATAEVRRLPDGSSSLERRPAEFDFHFHDSKGHISQDHIVTVEGISFFSTAVAPPLGAFKLRISLQNGALVAEAHWV